MSRVRVKEENIVDKNEAYFDAKGIKASGASRMHKSNCRMLEHEFV